MRVLLVVWCACGCGAIVYGDDDADAYDALESEAPPDDTDAHDTSDRPPDDGMDDEGPEFGDDGNSCDADCVGVCRDNGYTTGECRGPTCMCWNDTTDDGGGEDTRDDVSGESLYDADVPDTSDTVDACSCHGPFEGTGRTSVPGTCIETYEVGVVEGETYTVSTCGISSMDPLLAVYGACNCVLYEDCGGLANAGNYCSCTASSTGVMTICASAAQADETVRWSYTVDGPCYDL